MQEQNISINNFEQCLKCTICNDVCPMMSANPHYPGPKRSGPDGERYRLKGAEFYDIDLKYCLNCKRCEVACPSGVRIGDIIQSARLEYGAGHIRLRDRILANTDIVGTLAGKFAPAVNPALRWGLTKRLMDSVLKIDSHRTFPAYSTSKFTALFKKNLLAQQKEYSRQVSYFHGCYANYNYPKLALDFVKIMNACGYGVQLLEKEKCCGVALIANGLGRQAKDQASLNLASIRKAVKEGRKVLTTSSTCTFTMRDEYPHILGLDNSDVRDDILLAVKFIYDEMEAGRLKLAFRDDYRKKVAYHTACHIAKLGWQIYSVSLLRLIPGVELTVLEEQCCGIAGTFGFKKEYYDYSQRIGEGLFGQIRESGAELVSTDCETCKWQIEMTVGAEVANPITILADALDVEKSIKLNQ